MGKSRPLTGWLEYCLLCRYYWQREVETQVVKTWLRVSQYVLTGLTVAFTHYGVGSHPNPRATIAVIGISRFFMTIVSFPFFSKFLKEDRRWLREGVSGLSASAGPLLLAKFTIYLGVQEALALIYSVIVYPLANLRKGVERAALFILILWIHQFAKSALGFLISAAIIHRRIADLVLSFFAFLNLLFSGGVVSLERRSKLIVWIKYTSISFWAQEALMANQFGTIEDGGLWLSMAILAMLAYGLIFLALAVLALRKSSAAV